MTTARVPRQRRAEDRREALVAAASRLASIQGPGACTARAVATEAGLPLASVSYYFSDLSVLVGEAVRRVCERWRRQAVDTADRAATAGLTATGDPERLAVVIAAAILPPGDPGGARPSVTADPVPGVTLPDRPAVATRYRHLLAAADHAVVTAEMTALRAELVTVVHGLLPTSPADVADLLVTVVDGAALGAVAEGDPDPARRVVSAVAAALQRLA